MTTNKPHKIRSIQTGQSSGQGCQHNDAGAVECREGQWRCRDCGQKLQIAEVSTVWQLFGQISRCAAYCAILAACVPIFLTVFSEQDLRKPQPIAMTAVSSIDDDAEDDLDSPVPKWIVRAKGTSGTLAKSVSGKVDAARLLVVDHRD